MPCFEKLKNESFGMGVVIGAGKTLGFIDHKNKRLGKFRLNSLLPNFNHIPFRVYPYAQCGSLTIDRDLTFFD